MDSLLAGSGKEEETSDREIVFLSELSRGNSI